MSPATNSVGNPNGSPVLESQRISKVATPLVTSMSRLPKLSYERLMTSNPLNSTS